MSDSNSLTMWLEMRIVRAPAASADDLFGECESCGHIEVAARLVEEGDRRARCESERRSEEGALAQGASAQGSFKGELESLGETSEDRFVPGRTASRVKKCVLRRDGGEVFVVADVEAVGDEFRRGGRQ